MKKATFLITAIASVLLLSCTANTFEEISKDTNTPTPTTGTITYTTNVKPIIDANCISCHNNGGQSPSPPLVTFNQVANATRNGNVINRIQAKNGTSIMPPEGKMPTATIQTILDWASQGYAQ